MTEPTPHQQLQAALRHHQAGQLGPAEALYRQVLAREPNYPDALHLMGVVAYQTGRLDQATELIARAITLNAESADYHCNLGSVLAARGSVDGAVAAYRKAVALRPEYVEAHYNLGNALQRKGLFDDAAAEFTEAIKLRPQFAEAINDLGIVQCLRGKCEDGVAEFQKALAIRAEYPEALNNIGNALKELGRIDEAVAAYRKALEIRPNYSDALNNLGNTLKDAGKLEEAIATYRKALAIRSDSPAAHWNLGLTLLLDGQLAAGWPEHEWRWQVRELRAAPRQFSQPRWDGSDLAGRRILLHAEQGFGDTLQFVRYVPLVARRGGTVILECQPALARLMRTVGGVETLIPRGHPLPEFELQCPLLTLPLAMGTTIENIPADVPYLAAEPELVQQWRGRVPSDGRLRVGLVWSGSPKQRSDRNRSMRLETLAPLAGTGNTWFCSLQKGPAADQIAQAPPGLVNADLSADLNDFADTAALVKCLDLLITVDTAVAHLAGALGKPVWLMLPKVPAWRWLMQTPDCPWYPTMRLFRQQSLGDWSAPIANLAEALAMRAAGPR
jgi:Flp pilus assembly protein TadD